MKPTASTGATIADEERQAALGRLLPLWPHELADRTLAGQQRICRLLAAALRRERQRGVGGHWTYDLGRHAALTRALGQEMHRLAGMSGSAARQIAVKRPPRPHRSRDRRAPANPA